jgi:hypothetical protein
VIPIVLTGTIIPQAIYTKYAEAHQRRLEYLTAINFYRKFAPVFFLENSLFDMASDQEFKQEKDFSPIKIAIDRDFSKGKGYQEFQTLDTFVSKHFQGNAFIKITGRYIFKNFSAIYRCLESNPAKECVVMDIHTRRKVAITSIFYSTKDFYLRWLYGKCKQMDDSKDIWAERIYFKELLHNPEVTFFSRKPLLTVQEGSTGLFINEHKFSPKVVISNLQRAMFSLLKIPRLYY